MTSASDDAERRDEEERRHVTPRGPLDGIRVIEVGTLISGPFAGQLLGDMGAEVIDIEPLQAPRSPGAPGVRPNSTGITCSGPCTRATKEAATLNLRRPHGAASCFSDLIEKSDTTGGEFPARAPWRNGTSATTSSAQPQPGHHPGAGFRLWADRARGAQGRLRVGGRGGQWAAAPQRVPGRAAPPAGAVTRRQPGRHVRCPGRAWPRCTAAASPVTARSSTTR